MRNEMLLPLSLGARMRNYIQSAGEGLSQMYSLLMEEPVSVAQSWCILHASLAVVCTVFLPLPLSLRILSTVWMLRALCACRQSGLK